MTNESQTNRSDRPLRITETVHRNHEELFPNHKSTLKISDPELIELFDNFAFDEVLAHGKMDTKEKAKCKRANLETAI